MTPAPLEGQTLGKYRVLEPLGRGGMARVYRAYHPQLDRYVAIKVLRSDLAEDEEFLTRFRREARAVAALRHPNIVQVFDSDVEGDVYYMVLELLEGDTLKARLNDYRVRGEKMALGEIVRILLDVLDGLAYAHSEGMIHRDIKPANVLLTKRGQAVLADFGIAHIVGGTRHTISGALMGTLNYMAPEQGLEGHSDARSDIYSLGVVLYEMLTQRTPFEADTPLAVLMKHLNDPLPLPRQIEPGIPEPFERIVLKALAKRPEDRYQSAEEMARALRGAAKEAEIEMPARISLPLSFTTPEVPSESVAVFSGTARERIADAQFAADETDPALGQKLVAERAEGEQPTTSVKKELVSAVGALGRLVVGTTARALREAVEAVESRSEDNKEPETAPSDVRPEEMPDAKFAIDADTVVSQQEALEDIACCEETEEKRSSLTLAILSAVAILFFGNLILITIVGILDWWSFFERGWPVEILLISVGLCIIMATTRNIWMLIPVGIVLGNAMLFTYSAILNAWDHWGFLWVFEIWIPIGTVFLTIWLARQGEWVRRLTRPLAQMLTLVSVSLTAFVFVINAIIGVFDWIVSSQ